MPVLASGAKTTIIIATGDTVSVIADAIGTGQIWWTNPAGGMQDVAGPLLIPGKKVVLGPYQKRVSARIECATGNLTYSPQVNASPAPVEVARQMGTLPRPVPSAAYTLSDDDHGYILLFAQACTVTVPKGLRSDFSAGWSQENAGVVTFSFASGVTPSSKGAVVASSGQYAVGGIAALGADYYRLTGV